MMGQIEITWAENPFLEQVATFVQVRGLRLPLLLMLEAGRPLAFLGGQFLWIAQPALSLILPGQWIQQTAQLLEEPEAVAALIARLEEIRD
jgi:hypothetical protein